MRPSCQIARLASCTAPGTRASTVVVSVQDEPSCGSATAVHGAAKSNGDSALVESNPPSVEVHEPPMLFPHAVEPFSTNESVASGSTVQVPFAHGADAPEIVTTRPV